MLYLTGYLAFGTFCDLQTSGLWNIPKEDFLNPKLFILNESDDSILKDWGIEKDKIVRYHETETLNVANHIRAYVDLLIESKFDLLEGRYADIIGYTRYRKDIFSIVYSKLINEPNYADIEKFFMKEFGNAYLNFVESIEETGKIKNI